MDIKLVELVEKFPHLYNKKQPEYKDKRAVQNTWSIIAEEMNCEVSTCMSRWITLKNRFSKERAKVAKIKTGSAPCKEWRMMQHLSFLSPHMKQRKTLSNSMPFKIKETQASTKGRETEVSIDPVDIADIQDEVLEAAFQNENIITEEIVEQSMIVEERNEPEHNFEHTNSIIDGTTINSTSISGSGNHSTSRSGSRGRNSMKTTDDAFTEAVKIFKQVAENRLNTLNSNSVNSRVQNFCDSLASDLSLVPINKFVECKIEILHVVQKFINEEYDK